MSKLLFENKKVVIPGDILAEGMDYLPGKGAFREEENVIASRLGIVNVQGSIINIIPLSGRYKAKKNDTVIGYVKDMSKMFNGCITLERIPFLNIRTTQHLDYIFYKCCNLREIQGIEQYEQ